MPYDLVVIGTGPGGYVVRDPRRAARPEDRRASRRAPTLGGTCLNVGCIPSKALLHASELFEEAGHTFGKHGHRRRQAEARPRRHDEVQGRRSSTATSRASSSCSRRTRSTRSTAPAASPRAGKVEVTDADGKAQTLDAKAIVIATGSDVARAARARDRREARRVVDRRAHAARRCRSTAGHRRRRHRARARLGVAPPRRQGDGGRVPRPHPARHGRRGREAVPAPRCSSRASLQAVVQGDRGRRRGQDA